MKRILQPISLIVLHASASICKENLFVHVVYGWKSELALDSANWDVKSSGGDRNYYTYDAHNRIVKNVRKTSTVNDTTEFITVGADSLVWKINGVVSANYIKYIPNGYASPCRKNPPPVSFMPKMPPIMKISGGKTTEIPARAPAPR